MDSLSYPIWIYIASQLFALVITWLSYKKQSVDRSGAVAMIAISGLFIWTDQLAGLIILFSMFASSSLLSRVKNTSKEESDKVLEATGPRNWWQAICNLGVASVLLYSHSLGYGQHFFYAFCFTVAASNADSWASEIGMLSPSPPRSIITFKKLPVGLSGGVSFKGTLGAIIGAAFIGFVSVIVLPISGLKQEAFVDLTIVLPIMCTAAGTGGMLLDSILGASIQVKYQNSDDHLTERSDQNKKTGGISGIDNNAVNLIMTSAVAATSLILMLF